MVEQHLPHDLLHHGDREVGAGLLDLAVNVYDGPRPPWLDAALQRGLAAAGGYPDAAPAEAALAARHDRAPEQVLATAGAAEAFTLVARLRPWRHPVVVHPQFTEPHAALEAAGHRVDAVVLPEPFTLDLDRVPDDADLVVVGNPTNPTGVLHPAAVLEGLRRDGRLVVVDEAFLDVVPGEAASLVAEAADDLLVLRSLTKHWGIPGVRAGYAVGGAALVAELRRQQTPWSVSSLAVEAMVACASAEAVAEGTRRAETLQAWRRHLERGLRDLGVHRVASQASFVIAQPGLGIHAALRERGVAVRRCDTFPGLDGSWVRIAVRDEATTDRLLAVLADTLNQL